MKPYDLAHARMIEWSGSKEVLEEAGRTPRTGRFAPVFVVGCHRSGTTVLGRSLSGHPALAGAGESEYLRYLWEIFAGLHQGSFRKGRAWLHDYIAAGDLLELIGELSDGVIGSLCARTGKPRFVDHTPIYGLLASFLHHLYPDARFVHIVRDGRAVVRSLQHSAQAGFRWATGSVETLGHLWADIVEETDARCAGVAADRTLVVRYEDLCADPRGCLARVLEWCGLGWDDGVLAALSAEHANPSRRHATLARSEEGRIVLTPRVAPNAWPEDWGLEDREGFRRSAAATMRRLGYAPEPEAPAR